MTSGDDFCKNALSWHNAVTHSLINLTMTVAFFSNLCHLKYHISDMKSCSNRKRAKIKSLHDQIFTKCTIRNFCPFCTKFLNLFIGKQTDLTMPFSTVRISFNPPVHFDHGFTNLMFFGSSLFTDADSLQSSHFYVYPPICDIFFCSVIKFCSSK